MKLKRLYHLVVHCPTSWKSWWTGVMFYHCPVCGAGYPCYWDGHDCAFCGGVGVCTTCDETGLCCLMDEVNHSNGG